MATLPTDFTLNDGLDHMIELLLRWKELLVISSDGPVEGAVFYVLFSFYDLGRWWYFGLFVLVWF